MNFIHDILPLSTFSAGCEFASGENSRCSETITMNEKISHLLQLSRELGREDRKLCILAEGNTSVKLSDKEFVVKASGSNLATLDEQGLTACQTSKILALLNQKMATDEEIERELLQARLDAGAKKPSVESVFHGWLLTLEGIAYVGHCHPISANQVLCSPRARDFAERRLFPDEVVCCGPASVFVPYADPGLPLAREIKDRTTAFIKQNGFVPRLILLQNHGIIALGQSANAVLACTLMADKAASIFMGAAALGGPNFMTPQHIERIAQRPDEAYRQRQLKI